MTNQDKVREFHQVMGVEMRDKPGFVSDAVLRFRHDLVLEETLELLDATEERDLVETADALADLLYVVYGYALVLGIDIDRVFAIVHRTNMAKAPGGVVTRREDGKVLKPEGWAGPQEGIERELYKQGWKA